jgi:acetyl/propionyl-CoA carboxylase alpha subunit
VERVTRVGDGVYRIEGGGRVETVYVAGPPDEWWAFWNGRVFRGGSAGEPATRARIESSGARRSLTAPMPATVISIHVNPGDAVVHGQVVVLLEAMKMELPIRAPGAATVSTIRCRPGELVQADTVLVELE